MARSNRQKRYGDPEDWYLHPTKGFKRKKPRERAQNVLTNWKLENIFKMKGKKQ